MTPPGRVVPTGEPHVHLSDGAVRRALLRRERFLVYGLLGWATEVAFTGTDQALRGQSDRRLVGHSYLWMLPLYGLTACLFEPARDRLRSRPAWQRGAAYSAGIMATEFVCGRALQRVTGVCPWDYSGRGRLVVGGGVTRLDYAAYWLAAGLALERIDDLIRDAPLVPVPAH